MSLDPLDRSMLVTLMAGFDATRERQAPTVRSRARRGGCTCRRSARCSTRRAAGRARPRTSTCEQWRHLATLGRDHYVRVMYAGLPLPLRACGLAHQGDRAQVRVARRPARARRVAAAAPALLPGRARAGAQLHRREPRVTRAATSRSRASSCSPGSRPTSSEPGKGASALQPAPGVLKLYDGLVAAHAVLADGAARGRASSPTCRSRSSPPTSPARR